MLDLVGGNIVFILAIKQKKPQVIQPEASLTKYKLNELTQI